MDFERSWQSCIDSCYLQMPQYWICVPNTIRIYRQRFAALGKAREINIWVVFWKWSVSKMRFTVDYRMHWTHQLDFLMFSLFLVSWNCLAWFKLPFCGFFPAGHQCPGQLLLDGARYEPIGTHGQLSGLAALYAEFQRRSQFTWAVNRILWCGASPAVELRSLDDLVGLSGGSNGVRKTPENEDIFSENWMVGRWNLCPEMPKWSRLFRGHVNFSG